MEVILSAAVSIDGYLDDASSERLRLSSDEDWAAVLRLREECDAVLVGAATVRKDNPSLKGRALRVVVSRSGELPAGSRIFGSGEVLVLSGRKFTARDIVAELEGRGVRRLMVEGGAQILGMFLREGFADRLRLAVAPLLVGGGVRFPSVEAPRMRLEKLERLGGTAVMHYIKDTDAEYLARAVELSRSSVPSMSAYRVGAVILTRDGQIFEGYTHETDAKNHAEEEAVAKALAACASLEGAAIYVSMEPCSTRASKPVSCSELIIRHRFGRVVFVLKEPSLFVRCTGADNLAAAGIEVEHREEMASEVREINAHLLK